MALSATAPAAPHTGETGPDPRDALRQATAPLHHAVDAGMPLSCPAPSLSDYHAHLCLLRDWVRALRAGPVQPGRLDAESAALARDIELCETQGVPARAQAADAPAQAAQLPTAAQTEASAFAWGVAYVIEGSRLGGQVMHRRLADALAPHPLHYLQGAGAQTGANWRRFLDALRAALHTPERVQAACQGAVWAFETLLQLRGAQAARA